MGPPDARVVVGTLAIVVHLHEAGLGFMVGLRPANPSLAILAVDRQALLLKSSPPLGKGRGLSWSYRVFFLEALLLFWEREGVVVHTGRRCPSP